MALTIGRTTYPAVGYVQRCTAPPGSRNPGPYDKHGLCVIGGLPPSYKRNPGSESTPGLHYRIRGVPDHGEYDDWFVGTYWPPERPHGNDQDRARWEAMDPIDPATERRMHTFILFPWTHAPEEGTRYMDASVEPILRY